MSREVDFTNGEVMDRTDLTRMSTFAKEHTDLLTGGAIGYPNHWARFTVAVKNAQEVTVSPGEYYALDAVFSHRAAQDVPLQPFIPLVAGTTRWVALMIGGSTHVVEENRAIQTEEVEGQPGVFVTRQTPKIVERRVSIEPLPSDVAGAKPGLTPGSTCIAFVLLGTAGIEHVEPHNDDRVITLFEVAGRLEILESRVDRLRQDTETIASDLSGVAARLDTYPNPQLFHQFSNDISALNDILRREPNSRNYWFDFGLVADDWDLEHPLSVVRIDQGLRFQEESVLDEQLRLADPTSEDIVLHADGLLTPAYDEVLRIENPLGSGRKRISNVVHTVTTARKRRRRRTRVTLSPAEKHCENTAGWNQANLRDRAPGETFRVAGQEYQFVGRSNIEWNNTDTAQAGHLNFDVRRVRRETSVRTYTTYHTETFGLNNAAYAQTLQTSQAFMLTAIGIYLTVVDPAQEVTMAVGFVAQDGRPMLDAVMEEATVEGGDLQNGWTKFPLNPALIEQDRIAFVLATPGNNEIALTDDSRFAGGSFFTYVDDVFESSSATQDMSMQIWAAGFRASRTFVDFGIYVLAGGISHVQLNYQHFEPKGTALAWMIKPAGRTEWLPFDDDAIEELTNLPASVRLGCWFVGTQDIAPAIQMDQHARIRLWRMRNDLKAVTKEHTFGFSTDTVKVKINVDDFDTGLGDLVVPQLEVAGTVVDADAITLTADPLREGRHLCEAVFDFTGAEITAARIIIGMTKTSAVRGPFVQDVQMDAF